MPSYDKDGSEEAQAATGSLSNHLNRAQIGSLFDMCSSEQCGIIQRYQELYPLAFPQVLSPELQEEIMKTIAHHMEKANENHETFYCHHTIQMLRSGLTHLYPASGAEN